MAVKQRKRVNKPTEHVGGMRLSMSDFDDHDLFLVNQSPGTHEHVLRGNIIIVEPGEPNLSLFLPDESENAGAYLFMFNEGTHRLLVRAESYGIVSIPAGGGTVICCSAQRWMSIGNPAEDGYG